MSVTTAARVQRLRAAAGLDVRCQAWQWGQEVIEHVDPSRLAAVEDAVFAGARPAAVVVTTPNAEYNALYPTLVDGAFRHDDHRFEWTREQFRAWADEVAARHGYSAEFRAVGVEDAVLGAPTQLALFRREVAA